MSCLLNSRSRRRLAAVEPFGEDHAFLIVVAERRVEGVDLGVISADHELEFFDGRARGANSPQRS